MLSSDLNSSTPASTEQQDNPSTSYMVRIFLSVSLNPMLSSASVWIVDSGASKHIFNANPSFS